MKVTISDVARLAGVSTATVSHTINSTRYVSGETKEKVYRAIAELGYTPDASARSFRTGKKKTIGFIVPDISNKFFATMIESVENYLSAHGYHLIIANTKENPEREETNIRLLTAGLVDGLLVASTMDDFQRFDALIPAGFPVRDDACCCILFHQSGPFGFLSQPNSFWQRRLDQFGRTDSVRSRQLDSLGSGFAYAAYIQPWQAGVKSACCQGRGADSLAQL